MPDWKLFSRLPLGAVAVALAVPSFAMAEPAPGADSQTPPTLGEIIVTAQRVKENVQKVPISISVISGQTLLNEGKNSVDQALRDVPAIQIQSSPQGGQIFIRGVGNNGDNNVVDSDVALMFDGVFSGRAETALSNAYDIDRVEVLRGPQGTLYGRNATGGVVNVQSADPTDKLGAGINLGTGNYDLLHADGYINIPASSTLSFRLAGMRETRDGYFSNGGVAADATGMRFKVLFKPSSNVTLLGTVDYLKQAGLGQTSVLAPGTAATDPIFGNVNNPSSNPWDTSASVPFPYSVKPDSQDYRFYTYSLKADIDLGWGVLTVLPAFVHSNRWVDTKIFAPGPQTTTTTLEDQYTLEARLASRPGAPVKWVTGIYVLKDENSQPLNTQTTDETYYLLTPTKQPTSSYAGFGQITYPVTSQLRLTGGLRFNIDKKSKNYGICTTSDQVTCDGIYTLPNTTYSSKYNALTFKAGLEYDVAPASMVYAQVASGYKAGGYQLSNPPVAYRPERLLAFEVGSKNRLFGNKLQLNFEGYYYRYNNYQVTTNFYVPYTYTLPAAYCTGACATGNQFVMGVTNAASGTNYGAEIEAKFQPTQNDRFDASVALVHATYGDLSLANPGFPANGPPGTGLGGDPYDVGGRPVASTAHRVLNLGYTHSIPLAGGVLDLHGQSRISTGYYDTIFEGDSAAWQPSFTRSDANLTFRSGENLWRIGVWVKNIENKAQITNNFPFYRVMISDPRTFGASFNLKY